MTEEVPNAGGSDTGAKKSDLSSQGALELYKVAFERLTFQDDYLFKFATVFLAVHGALGVLAQAALLGEGGPNLKVIGFTSGMGIFLAIVWMIWTYHNDYWHAVWIGVLQDIETKHLNVSARVFAADHHGLAKRGNRQRSLIFRGHTNAVLIPYGIAVAWVIALGFAVLSCPTAVQPSVAADPPASAAPPPHQKGG